MSVIRRRNMSALASLFSFAAAFGAVACTSSLEEASTSTDTSESELKVSPSGSDASLTIATDDGSCGDVKSLVQPRIADIRALCPDKEIALPRDVVRDGCEAKAVKSITFRCFVAKRPPPPPNGCQELTIKDEKGVLPAEASESADALPPLLCPGFDGMQPPPLPAPPAGGEGCDGGARPEGPPPPPPPPPGAGGSAPGPMPGAPTGDAPAGAPGPHGGPHHGPPGPPRFSCCLPPHPGGGPGGGPGGAGGPSGPPSGEGPGAPVEPK